MDNGYYVVFVWNDLRAIQNLPCPIAWGWARSEDRLSPFWSELPEISEASCHHILNFQKLFMQQSYNFWATYFFQ